MIFNIDSHNERKNKQRLWLITPEDVCYYTLFRNFRCCKCIKIRNLVVIRNLEIQTTELP